MVSDVLISFPPFRLDTVAGRLWHGTEPVVLRPKLWDVLLYLVARHGQLISKVELLDAVWPEVTMDDEMASGAVRELRRVLGDDADPARFIEVVRGRGYRFIAAIDTVALPPQDSTQLSRLVGRDGEVATLLDHWRDACAGRRRMLLITGEPGLGKTSLVARVIDEAQAGRAGATGFIVHAQCIEQHSVVEPFMPILDTLGHLCAGPDAARVSAVLRRYAPAWLLQLPHVTGPNERQRLLRDWAGVTPERLLRMLLEALDALAEELPLLLVFEDLHWADLSTLDLLARLAHRPERSRMLIVGTYRPAEAALRHLPLRAMTEEMRLHGRCQELALEYLDRGAVEQLLSLRYPGCATPELVEYLRQRTAGNPLFLLLLLDGLQAAGMLVPDREGWHVEPGWQRASIPDSVRNLIARQINRLSAEQVALLEIASLIGIEIPLPLLIATMMTESELTSDAALQLVTRCPHLTRSATVAGERSEETYRFVHPLYREVMETQIPAARRRDLHLRIAATMAIRAGDGLANDAIVAWHYARGGDAMRAVEGYARAITDATSRYAYAQIIQAAEALTELIPQLPESKIRIHCDVSARMSWASALIATQGFAAPAIESIYTTALEHCRDIGDTPMHLVLIGGMCAWRMTLGDLKGVVPWREEFLGMCDRLNLPPMFRPAANALLGQVATYRGELGLARSHLDEALQWAASAVPLQQAGGGLWVDPEVSAAAHSSWVAGLQGFTQEAIARAERAVARARSIGHPYSVAFSLVLSCHTDAGLLRWDELRAHAAEALSITIEHELSYFHSHASILAALADCATQPDDTSFQRAAGEIERFVDRRVLLGLSSYLVMFANTHDRAGRPQQGLATVDRALQYASESGEEILAAELYRLRGEFLLRTGDDPATAESWIQQAITKAKAQGAAVLELRAAQSLARLRHAQDPNADLTPILADIVQRLRSGEEFVELDQARALLGAQPTP